MGTPVQGLSLRVDREARVASWAPLAEMRTLFRAGESLTYLTTGPGQGVLPSRIP